MANVQLDPAIIKALPLNSEIVFADVHGKTNWARGIKVEVEVGGKEYAFFLKVTERENASLMAQGEYESQKAMKKFLPANMANPLAWGPLESNPSQAFYMCDFHDLRVQKPSPAVVASMLSQLHHTSFSPTGQFGFPVPTFKGYARMDNIWCDKWEDWFAGQFRADIKFEQSIRGPDPEMDDLYEQFETKVIPRLLRPLQTGGRDIKPSLVHTDIWHGNIHTDTSSKKSLIFDACCVYGHHEMELGMFRGQHYGWSPEYMEEYLKQVQPSEPRQDFDDRNAIYAMRNYIVTAGLWQHWIHLRGFVKEEMRRLLEKHPDGFGGFVEESSVSWDGGLTTLAPEAVHSGQDEPMTKNSLPPTATMKAAI